MCFNALISNTDDHPRNHAIIAKDHNWRLSPAYDLTPGPLVGLERRDLALDIGELGRYANARNLLSRSERFLLKTEEAKVIIDVMEKQVKESWRSVARSSGVSERDCELISGAFVYPGFRFTPS